MSIVSFIGKLVNMTNQETKLIATTVRREYGARSLDMTSMHDNPVLQFNQWLTEILPTEPNDPTAMVLSTVDEQGYPDSRVVLLKEVCGDEFVFYSHYNSAKGKQIEHAAHGAINFYWPHWARQIRIKGEIVRISATRSDTYFYSRPLSSQYSAMLSPQSQEIDNNTQLHVLLEQYLTAGDYNLPERPATWGGYALIPNYMEFWQGRNNRLHDRVAYKRQNKTTWLKCYLAP